MSTILPGNQESAALALDGGMYGLLVRRYGMMGVKIQYIVERGSDGIINDLLDIMYSKGAISNPNGVTRAEAAVYTSDFPDHRTTHVYDGLVSDYSFLQYFTSATSIEWSDYNYRNNLLVVLPPSITTMGDMQLYRYGGTCKVVFLGLTPPSKVSNYYFGYTKDPVIYCPDQSLTLYQNKLTSRGYTVKPISELDAEDAAKIKIPFS